MQLNPDCVRDILLSIESVTDYNTVWKYEKGKCSYDFLSQYSHNEIVYHVTQCERANLITKPRVYNAHNFIMISDLTPAGHQFLDFARSSTIWEKVKNTTKEFGIASIPSIIQVALEVGKDFLTKL